MNEYSKGNTYKTVLDKDCEIIESVQMLKAGNFTCETEIRFWNTTLIMLNCYRVVLRSDFKKLLQNESNTCSYTCTKLDDTRVDKLIF